MGATQPDKCADAFPMLADLVGEPDHFAAECWGRRPFRRTAAIGVPTLSIKEAEVLLDSSIRSPSIRLVRDGRPLPATEWTTPVRLGGVDLSDVADGRKVASAVAGGATLVLQGLHRTVPTLIAYGIALEDELSHPVQINAYVTPPRSRGLAEHTDAHDVFVVQSVGSKRWWVDGLDDVTMRPGDVLYVPAHTAHRAESLDAVSLHLTIGILRRTGRHLVERALRSVSALDDPVPLGFARDADAFAYVLSHWLERAATELRDHVDPVAFVDAWVERRRPRARAAGRLQSIEHATTAALESLITWRDGNRLEVHQERIVVCGDERWLDLPTTTSEALQRLSDAGSMRIGDLPGLDDDSRLVLARRLIRDGFADLAPARVHETRLP